MIASTSRCVDWPAMRPRPSTLAHAARNSRAKNQPLDRGAAKDAAGLLVLAGLGSVVLLERVGFPFVFIRIGGRGGLGRNIFSLDVDLVVLLQPFFRLTVGV